MLDICKFCCALLILFYHYFSEHGGLPGILNEALSLYAVAVALFMAISGFLIFSKVETCSTRSERWRVVVKQIKRVLRVYLLWSVPYLLFQISQWSISTLTMRFILEKVQGWVFSSTFYTIWFMPALCVGLLLAFAATEYLPEVATHALAALIYATGSLMLTYRFVGEVLPVIPSLTVFADKWMGGARGGVFFGFPLIIAGRFVSQRQEKCKSVSLFILSFIFMALLLAEALVIRTLANRNTGIDMTFFMIPLVMCVLGFLVSVPLRSGKICIWMRQMSTLVFMTQRIFLSILPVVMVGFSCWQSPLLCFILMCGGTIAFSSVIIFLSRKLRWLKRMC